MYGQIPFKILNIFEIPFLERNREYAIQMILSVLCFILIVIEIILDHSI